MKKFLTVLLVIAVMFTFSFGSAFATVDYKGDTTNTQAYEVSDFYADADTHFEGAAADRHGSEGAKGITEEERASLVYGLETKLDNLNDYGYTEKDNSGLLQTTFCGTHLTNVIGYVNDAIAEVNAAKTSKEANAAITKLNDKIDAEYSVRELIVSLAAETAPATAYKITMSDTGTYVVPGYGYFKDATSAILPAENDASKNYTNLYKGIATGSTGKWLKWMFDNGYETKAQITSDEAKAAFKAAAVLISDGDVVTADAVNGERIYVIPAQASTKLDGQGIVLNYEWQDLGVALSNARVTDIDAVYAAKEAIDAFENKYGVPTNASGDTDKGAATVLDYATKWNTAVNYYYTANLQATYKKLAGIASKDIVANKAEFEAYAKDLDAFMDKYGLEDADMTAAGITAYKVDTQLAAIEKVGAKTVADALADVPTLAENIKAADKADVDALKAAYEAYKADYPSSIYTSSLTYAKPNYAAYILAAEANYGVEATVDDFDATAIQNYLNNATIKVTTQALGNGKIRVKTTIDSSSMASLTAALKAVGGYTFEYKFYKKTAKGTSYKGYSDRKVNYTTFKLTKGTKYNFKCAVTIKDIDGNVIASTPYMSSTTGIRTAR